MSVTMARRWARLGVADKARTVLPGRRLPLATMPVDEAIALRRALAVVQVPGACPATLNSTQESIARWVATGRSTSCLACLVAPPATVARFLALPGRELAVPVCEACAACFDSAAWSARFLDFAADVGGWGL